MKTKFLYIAALAGVLMFTSCKNDTPYDTQSPDDAPLILIPYETSTGHLSYTCPNPDTPLHDSVIVTPSRYTTVYWYLDDQLVWTGREINLCFPTGKYALVVEAVTTAGKSTRRTGTVTVKPYDTDPYAEAPAAGRYVVAGLETTLNGKNLNKVARIIISEDVYGDVELCAVEPTTKSDGQLTFTLPSMQEGAYYLRFVDAEGYVYGSDVINILNGIFALSGYDVFTPNKEWVITGVNLQDVVAVKVGNTEITTLTATSTSVTLTAPDVAVGEYTLSMRNSDGTFVKFGTDEDAPTEVTTRASVEITLWTGPVSLKWDASRVNITSSEMAVVAEGQTICIYWSKLPDGDPDFYDPEKGELNQYYKMQIITNWWTDIVAGFDVTDLTPNPFTMTYDAHAKSLVNEQQAFAIVGWGLKIEKITYK